MALLKLIDVIKNKTLKKDTTKKDAEVESYGPKYKYKVGDKVIARRPLDTEEWPFWSDGMDEFEDRVLRISIRNTKGADIYYRVLEDNGRFMYKESWLEPYHINDDEEEDIVAVDLTKLL